MRNIIICITALYAFCACAKHDKLLVGGEGWNEIAILDKESGAIEWSHPLEDGEECNDLEMTPQGQILYACQKGAKLITRDHRTVWEYNAGEKEEIHTATRLPSGNYMLCVNGMPTRIVELDKNGAPVGELKFNSVSPDVHHQFRQILKTPQNTYLLPFMSKGKITEMTETGKVRRSVLCAGTPNSVKLLDNGHWLVSCGSARALVEIDPDARKIVNTITTTSLNWGVLGYIAEVIRFKNGHTLITNAELKNDDETPPSQSRLIEIDADNHVVWRLPANPAIKNITAVYAFQE